MKRVRCPKCGLSITFDETRYEEGATLIFECQDCHKQFGIRIGASTLLKTRKEEKREAAANKQNEAVTSQQNETVSVQQEADYGYLLVIENAFHYSQTLKLQMGDNVIGRQVRGTNINQPIETVDPSMDTTHCIINVSRNRKGALVYTLRDAPSGTGTFLGNDILRDNDRMRLDNEAIITIGATTMIFHAAGA